MTSGVSTRRFETASPCRRMFLIAACLVLLTGCSPLYVLRSGYEEARILWRRQPIERLLQQPDVDDETRSKLALVLDVRAFARDTLRLRVGGSFRSLARVDRNQVVYVVAAAPRDRLEPVTWWFPIVGAVPYKGFFDAARADDAAADLERQGFDTIVRPSVAFSTLGWFDDPLLSNLLRYDPASLASIIIHELTHNTRYLPGQTMFNESFANFVGYRGAVAFFESRHDPETASRAEQLWSDALAFSQFLGQVIARLQAAYTSGIDEAERQRLFRDAQADFRRLPWQTNLYAEFDRAPLNNAVIVHFRLYNQRLALFQSLFERHHGDLGATIATVLQAVDGAADPFEALRRRLGDRPAPEVAVDVSPALASRATASLYRAPGTR